MIKQNPKLSVIVPVYNVEKVLSRAIDSILFQTYENFELILIDDGSNDNSSTICDLYKEKDDRVCVIHKINQGQAEARNDGIRHAKGDYISLIDSDDVIDRIYFEEMFKLIEKYDADIASCSFKKFYSNDEIIKKEIKPIEEVYYGENILKEYFNPQGKNLIYHNIWNKIYKKELFKGVFFSKGRVHDDLSTLYKILNNSKCLVTTNQIYYYYYKNNKNSITNNYSIRHMHYSFLTVKEMLDFFKDRDSIKNDLYLFALKQSVAAYEESFKIDVTPEFIKERKAIKNFILSNVVKYNVSLKEKIKILIRIFFPTLHKSYSKRKNR